MNEEIRQTIAALLAGDDPDARRQAAEALADVHGLAAISALAAALQDDSKGVRDAATRSLLNLGGRHVALAIVEYIGNRNIITRNLSAEILVKLGSESIPALVPLVRDPDRDVRKFAVDILGLIGDPEPLDAIVSLLADPDENVVVSAVEALGNLHHPRALPALEETYDRVQYTRATVAEAVGKIKDPQATGFLLARFGQCVEGADMDPVTLFAIVEALGAIGDASALAPLEKGKARVKGKVRSMLLHALMQISDRTGAPLGGSEGLVEDFIRALSDDDVQVRTSAARWLTRSGGVRAVPALLQTVGKNAEIDAVLVPYLGQHAEFFTVVSDSVEQAPPAQRKALMMLVSRLTINLIASLMRPNAPAFDEASFDRAFELIAQQWDAADEESRAVIVDALFRLDGDRAVQFLDRIMNDPDPWLRMHVIEVIAAINDRRAPDFIARFLSDDNEMVREVAASTLQAKGLDIGEGAPGPNA
jgi:HEAT repeat protein